jgi:hypothetical protein
MGKVSGRLIVFFEEPFWVGVFENEYSGKLSVCKITFEQSQRIMKFMISF